MLRSSLLLFAVNEVHCFAIAAAPAPRPLLLASRQWAPRLVEPDTWSEWALRDVGILDGSVLAVAMSGLFVLSSRSGSGGGGGSSGSSGGDSSGSSTRDPNELPSILEARESRSGGPPQMAAPAEALPDIVVPAISDTDDERLWVPQTDCLSFRPLCLCVSQGYYVNLLRFVGGGTLGCHRHSSPVHAHTIRGTWGYKEHAWEAQAGTYVFEPPGETHTLVVGEEEMITLFHVTGALLYCDPDDPATVLGFDDVFTKLEKARAHYKHVGLGADYVDQFIR